MAKIENIRWLSGFIHGLGEFAIKHGRKTLYGLINTAGEIVLEPQPKIPHICDEKLISRKNTPKTDILPMVECMPHVHKIKISESTRITDFIPEIYRSSVL